MFHLLTYVRSLLGAWGVVAVVIRIMLLYDYVYLFYISTGGGPCIFISS